ncbi:MAG: hypothetical protein FJ271_25300 [Planctomycetes bacterium]|nr:hypothetical protein [Planctomycetota bacterium]
MDFDSSFADVLARLHAGDEAAAAEIFSRYSQRLIAVASAKLGGAMRRKVDAEDLAQSAMKSFFRAEAEGGLCLDSWSDLWALLTTITLRKCGHQVRQFFRAKSSNSLQLGCAGQRFCEKICI